MCSARCIAISFVILVIVLSGAHLVQRSFQHGFSFDTTTARDVMEFCEVHLSLVLTFFFGIFAIIGLMTDRSCLVIPFLIGAVGLRSVPEFLNFQIIFSVLGIVLCIWWIPETDFSRITAKNSKALECIFITLKTVASVVATISLLVCTCNMKKCL
ncbi:hypothetical protein L596_015654 [Steinernema carpocapsae]|uniref:Uncharacterized protein n=1 Tax=Steinernema carpocapsae TaxID=34508 RepID=A0A4U5NFN4_STECR|nr:hypothetical protein L596_015654 [Steinernema carpocapsae]